MFDIITPILPNRLNELLNEHPNRPLVESIIHGFQHGFWPFANVDDPKLQPAGIVNGRNGPPDLDEESVLFLRQQRDTEMELRRYSPSFGTSLLPGMVAQPIFTVPKKGSSKLRLVNDHSAGLNSLNSLIPAEGGFVILDNLSDLAMNIRSTMASNGGRHPCLLWKSDVSQAYRHIPMHPRWQVRQASLINGHYHIDRCAVFGNHASGRIWCIFFSLVCWVAIHKFGIADMLHYVDDAFNVAFTDEYTFYKPNNRLMPTAQARFLEVLDYIGLQHDNAKQVHGEVLDIIGFEVDLPNMTIRLSAESKQKLVEHIRDRLHPKPSSPLSTTHASLAPHAWLCQLGAQHFPIAQTPSDNKVAGHHFMNAPVYFNKKTTADLLWFADQVERLDGVRFLGAEE